jgi:nicotinate-nucleotide adenylyltransferase
MNFAVASRPNYDLAAEMSPEIRRALEEYQTQDLIALETTPYGLIYIDESLSVDLSSTDLRNRLKTSDRNLIEADQIPSHTLQIITNLGLYQ